MKYEVKKGNLITETKAGQFDIIIHGCNAFHAMGSGVAKALRNEWPQIYEADVEQTIRGDYKKLGTYSVAELENGVLCLNCYTQYAYGTDSRKLNYEAIYSCFEKINANFPNKRLGAPKIGCNLAGGNWEIVETMMNVALKDLKSVTVLEL